MAGHIPRSPARRRPLLPTPVWPTARLTITWCPPQTPTAKVAIPSKSAPHLLLLRLLSFLARTPTASSLCNFKLHPASLTLSKHPLIWLTGRQSSRIHLPAANSSTQIPTPTLRQLFIGCNNNDAVWFAEGRARAGLDADRSVASSAE